MKKKSNKKLSGAILSAVLIAGYGIYNNYESEIQSYFNSNQTEESVISYNIEEIPEYNGENYIVINDNVPFFTSDEITTESFENYSELDYLGRCGVAFANVSVDTMPTEARESIGMIKPSGWHTVKYDIVDGKYLYNRCHLIGYQLTGENANELNLITCTRNMNNVGMLEFENKVASYVKETKNHVLYRVTPIFEGSNLLASGVEIEAYSVEDNGEGIQFNVYIYNVQDGITIDYATGDSSLSS
jgi:DNA-entry nuclease